MTQSGGAVGVLNLPALESALAQPRMTFGGEDLYPTLVEKAAALGHSLIANHPFVDGNKRTGHAAMEVFLMVNGCEIQASVKDTAGPRLSRPVPAAARADPALQDPPRLDHHFLGCPHRVRRP